MLWLLKKAFEKVRMAVLLPRQHSSITLRQIFRARYDVDVGLHSYGCFDQWRMRGPMRVGRYCSIARTARSALDNHPTDAITTHPILYETKFGVVDVNHAWSGSLDIGDDVWIGHYAVVLPGCRRIGRGAIIGAGAIVTHDVAPYTIVAGNPAKVIRQRFPSDLINAIEKTRWWELEPAELKKLGSKRPDLLFHPTISALDDWHKELLV